MEIGICINMYPAPNGPEQTGVENIPLYRDAGFDYLELPGGALMQQKPAELKETEKRLLSCGMPLKAMSSLLHPSIKVVGPTVDRARVDAYLDGVFALAARLGTSIIVLGSARAREVPFGFPPDQAWRQLVDLFHRLGSLADRHDMTIVIEHINRWEANSINTFAEGAAMVREVGHPRVRCLVDYYHLGLGNEGYAAVRENFTLIRHAHVANLLERSLPVLNRHEQGVREYVRLLRENGYQGGLSVEGYTRDPADFASSVKLLRELSK